MHDPAGGDDYPVEGLGIVLVLSDERIAVDFRGVVHAVLHTGVVEVEDLFPAMGGDGPWEPDLEPTPPLPVFFPWLDFLCLYPGVREHERFRHVVPHSVA